MIRLNKPYLDFSEIFDLCVSSLEDSNNKQLITDNKLVFLDSYQNYLNFGERDLLQVFPDRTKQITSDKKQIEYIKNLYDKFRKGAKTAEIYEKIRVSTERCAYCNQGIVYPLDHYLPKSKFPLLSINFLNLIPSCSDCNFTLNKLSLSSKRYPSPIHPYFEHNLEIYENNWIFGRVPDLQDFYTKIQVPPVVEFYTDFTNLSIDANLQSRLEFQFNYLIKPQFNKQCTQLVSGEINQLFKMKEAGLPGSVLIKYCEERIDNYPLNSYLRGVYFAFADSSKLIDRIINYPVFFVRF